VPQGPTPSHLDPRFVHSAAQDPIQTQVVLPSVHFAWLDTTIVRLAPPLAFPALLEPTLLAKVLHAVGSSALLERSGLLGQHSRQMHGARLAQLEPTQPLQALLCAYTRTQGIKAQMPLCGSLLCSPSWGWGPVVAAAIVSVASQNRYQTKQLLLLHNHPFLLHNRRFLLHHL
jgi:hypothetical protein